MQAVAEHLVLPPDALEKPWLYGVAKRALDIVVSLIALVLLAPVFVLCALAIILDSPGPVLFRQQRVGRRGRVFTMLKFRSMVVNAESDVHREYATAFVRGQAEPQVGEHGAVFKLAKDTRITRAGRWLRRTSLDELPQLWNTFRGDMTLVGPRPPLPYEVDHYEPAHLRRLAVKPGITGPWQVSGRSATTFDQMVEMDLAYIRSSSLMLDLQILLKTIPVVLRMRGAH